MAVYWYLEVAKGDPQSPEDRFDYSSPRLVVEIQINQFYVNLCQRKDLLDGRRVYRIPDREIGKLPKDKTGPYLLNPKDEKSPFRWTSSDSTTGLPLLRDWVNIRS